MRSAAHRFVPINETTITRDLVDWAGWNVQNANTLIRESVKDGKPTVTLDNKTKRSIHCIDNARRLGSEHLAVIDGYIERMHAKGGYVYIRAIRNELKSKYPGLKISAGAVRYALIHFCNCGEGYKWGKVKSRKCDSDPERIDVKRTYLRDYFRALELEKSGTHIIVYLDGAPLPLLSIITSTM